jgi:hypothetical protein
MKPCSQCGETKPLDQFAKLATAKDGRRSYCKRCGRKYGDLYRVTHRPIMSAKQARWREGHRDHYRAYQREYQRLYRMRVISTLPEVDA